MPYLRGMACLFKPIRMTKKIQSALISVYYKDGLEPVIKKLSDLGVTIYTTGGTQAFIEKLNVPVVPVEKITGYPTILGGRVKSLHPSVFGGILGRRDNETDVKEMEQFDIPEIDLVIVDLYPFEETLKEQQQKAFSTGVAPIDIGMEEALIIEKIDIGGPSLIRAAAKNFNDVLVVAAKKDYAELEKLLHEENGESTLEQRKVFAAKAFEIVAHYDVAIAKYFNLACRQAGPSESLYFQESVTNPKALRYGENPHQGGVFYGDIDQLFDQLSGKELSYNNLVDVDAAVQLINEAPTNPSPKAGAFFAIIKHTNVCGAAFRDTVCDAWEAALAGDPESAFGGVLICNSPVDEATAHAINEMFFEVLVAPAFNEDALTILKSKKNRIILKHMADAIRQKAEREEMYRSLLNGVLIQEVDKGNYREWKETGGRETNALEKEDLIFANLICKHLKSNAIALVKNKQLIGKGCGQTSRIDALNQAIEKARHFNLDLKGAVMASDAFFPFDDCVKMGHEAGITAFIQPGGSIRDNDSIDYCKQNNLAMVMTGLRHFKH